MILRCAWHPCNFGSEHIIGREKPYDNPDVSDGMCKSCLNIELHKAGLTKYPAWQRFVVWATGAAKLGLRQPEGYKAPTMFYLVHCDRHGYFEDCERTLGFHCPECWRPENFTRYNLPALSLSGGWELLLNREQRRESQEGGAATGGGEGR